MMLIKSVALLALIVAVSAGPIHHRPRRDADSADAGTDAKVETKPRAGHLPEPITTYPLFPSHLYPINLPQPSQDLNFDLWPQPQKFRIPGIVGQDKSKDKQEEEPQEGSNEDDGHEKKVDTTKVITNGYQWGSSVVHSYLPHAQQYVWPSTSWGHHQPLIYQPHGSPYYWPLNSHAFTYVVAHQPVGSLLPPPPPPPPPSPTEKPATEPKTDDDKEEADVEMIDKMKSGTSDRVVEPQVAAMEADVLDEDESTPKVSEATPDEAPAPDDEEGEADEEERKK